MTNPADAHYIIPCRSGTRRSPDKNFRMLGGRPLWRWTTDLLREQGLEDRLLLVTDDGHPERGYPYSATRPRALARDDTPTEDVVRWASWQLGLADSAPVVLLQPTTPFRLWADVDNVLQALGRSAYIGIDGAPSGSCYGARAGDWRACDVFPVDQAVCISPTGENERQLDIDTEADWDAAEALLARFG